MRPIFVVAVCIIFCNFLAKSQDSIQSRKLDEIVVLGERGWIENGVINYIPSKSEKKLSNSPASLIKSMHLPFLKEKDGSIVSLSGEPVTVFINGRRADDIDLVTFWPKEVKRVQYIENPSDPRYEGVKKAVDFLMPEYKAGGVSRINFFQKIPDNGYYALSSKAVYRKMTYGVVFSGSYFRDHRSGMTGESSYKDIFYNDEKYDRITRNEESTSFNRDEGIQCAINAKYIAEKTRITHTVLLGWTRNPGSGSHGNNVWSENLFNSSESSNYFESYNLSPQLLGNYSFKLSDKWQLLGFWKYLYARNKNLSYDRFGVKDPVYNSNYEDVNSCKFLIMPSYILSRNLYFQLRTECGFDWYSTHYSGSANTDQNQSRQEISSTFSINWMPTQSFGLSFDSGVSASLWRIDGICRHTVNPIVTASLGWNPVRKFSINGALRFYMRPASASESNPVMIKTSEFLWLLGNPYLKNLTSWDTYINSTYLPQRWLSVSWGFGYVRTLNNIIFTYTPASPELGGLIKETDNAKPSDNIRANIELRSSLLDGNFSVGISPQWYYTHVRGAYSASFSYFTLSASMDYTIGDFRMELWYEGPFKDLSESGMERSWRQDRWNASLTYGNGNLFLSLRFEDILNNRRKRWIKFTSPNFTSQYNYLETGRTVSLNLTYTFGYGKKVDKNIDISGPESMKTSVLRTK